MNAEVEVIHGEPEEPDFPDRPDHLITIFVDDIPRKVRPGLWLVSKLKAALHIDPALILAEVTPHGLKDLADDARIRLHEDEHFVVHGRGGAAS